MGATKAEKFSENQKEIAQYASAIAHPARLAILQHLASTDSCICGDIVDQVPLAQATISQHLKKLKEIGLIQGTTEGSSICYCIDRQNWAKMKKCLGNLLNIDLFKSKNSSKK